MKRTIRLFWVFVLSISLLLPLGVAQGAEKIPNPVPAGVQIMGSKGGGKSYTPGTWYLGSTPPNVDYSKPPIVFVQGKNGVAQSWWEDTVYHGRNDMYDYAYNNGYRTAFVQLYDAAGNGSHDMWDNGQLLAQLLREISEHFGEKVNVVSHSKGGIDTQAALIHYNAWPYVGKVITLGTPHHGSHLANLAYSSWAGWLADLLGQQDDGTYVLQTGYMEYFRSITDNHSNRSKNMYYTAAGTSWGPFPSALWTGGAYLAFQGQNDGLVNVWSTQLPYGRHLFTANYDHDNIRMGRTAFPRIESELRNIGTTMSQAQQKEAFVTKAVEPNAEGEQIVRGGPLQANKMVEETMVIESGRQEAIFQVLTKNKNVDTVLISPSGKMYTSRSAEYLTAEGHDVFKGASVKAFRISRPEAGTWKVRLTSKAKDAYLLMTTLPGAPTIEVDLEKPARGEVPVHVKMKNPDKWELKNFDVKMKVVPTTPRKDRKMKKEIKEMRLKQIQDKKSKEFTGKISGKMNPGVYNVTLEIQGETKDGEPYQRTVIRSFFVPGDKKEDIGG